MDRPVPSDYTDHVCVERCAMGMRSEMLVVQMVRASYIAILGAKVAVEAKRRRGLRSQQCKDEQWRDIFCGFMIIRQIILTLIIQKGTVHEDSHLHCCVRRCVGGTNVGTLEYPGPRGGGPCCTLAMAIWDIL